MSLAHKEFGTCTACKATKPIADFYLCKKGKYRVSACKECTRQTNTARIERNRVPTGRPVRRRGLSHAQLIEKYTIPVPWSGCLIWEASANPNGYGSYRKDGKLLLAHRVSYELTNGPIPEGICILHKCDIPSCVNPDHLFPGTKKDNTHDMINKGRAKYVFGEQCPAAKLTRDAVLEIRKREAPAKELAEIYGVSLTSIYSVWNDIYWRHT